MKMTHVKLALKAAMYVETTLIVMHAYQDILASLLSKLLLINNMFTVKKNVISLVRTAQHKIQIFVINALISLISTQVVKHVSLITHVRAIVNLSTAHLLTI